MSYKLTHEKRETYLYFHVEGQDSLDVSKAYFIEVFRLAGELGYQLILIDEALKGSLSVMEMYQLTEMISDLQGSAILKIAFIDRNADNPGDQEFGITVVRNRGMNARRFSNVEAGEAWLLEK